MRIAVIAPMIQLDSYHLDLTVRLKENDREVTLDSLYQLALRDFKTETVPWELKHEDDIPAAGYYLTALLRKEGYPVYLSNNARIESLRQMEAFGPDIVCISTTMIVSISTLREIVRQIRNLMPDVFIIAGGVFIWKNFLAYQGMHYDTTKDLEDYNLFHARNSDMGIDAYVAAPHGRDSLLRLLEEFGKGRMAGYEQIPNLVLARPQGFFHTSRQEENIDFDNDFIHWEYIDEMPLRIPLRTSIGCPYRCRFCDFCVLYPGIFLRSCESLQKEIYMIRAKLGQQIAVIHITDDNIFINPKRLDEICNLFGQQDNFHWIAFMRASSIKESNIDAIKRSGLLMAFLGVESGDRGQLQRMRKSLQLHEQKKGIELLDNAGISILMSLLIGFPGENEVTIRNTADFINNLDLRQMVTTYQMFPMNIFPLSDLGNPEFRKKYGLTGNDREWSHATMTGQEAPSYGYDLFRQVAAVPYHYYDESHFFNRGVFTLEERIRLFRLRHELTINIIEKQSRMIKKSLIREMIQIMGFDPLLVTDEVTDQFYVKEQEHFKLIRK